jgi:hypothetical protein
MLSPLIESSGRVRSILCARFARAMNANDVRGNTRVSVTSAIALKPMNATSVQ